MTKLALAHNHYDEKHLAETVEKMRTMGAPTVRAYHVFDDIYQAIEGCHRLRACEILEIEPEIEYIEADTLISELEDLDYEGDDCSESATVGNIGDWENYSIDI